MAAVLSGPALTLVTASPVLAAQEGGGGLFSINVGLVFWTWVIFIILFVVLGKWAWGPILGALDARERRIQEALDEATREREEAAELLQEHKRLMQSARGEAQEILAEGRKAAEQLRSELLEEGRRQREEILERARNEIDRERERALDALRREAVEISIAAASRVLERNLDSDENRRLVDDYLDHLAGERAGQGNGKS